MGYIININYKKLEVMIKYVLYLMLIISFVKILHSTYWMVFESPKYYKKVKIWGVVFVITLVFLFSW